MAVAELGEGLLVRLLDGLMAAVPDAAGAGLVLLDAEQSRLVGGVGLAPDYDAAQLACGSGPLMEAAQRDEVAITDPFSLRRYPDLARTLADPAEPAPSAVVVIPGAWVDDTRLATTLYLRGTADTDALDMLGWYEPLLANALGLLEYCGEAESKAEQLLAMVQYRRVIEQAKGVIMSRRSVTPDDAFAELVAASQASNVRLRTLAIALVEVVGGGSAEHPRHPYRTEQSTPAARTAATELWARLSADAPRTGGGQPAQRTTLPPVRGIYRDDPLE
ncbi:MAG TPA: ANTAR domain-containing protein [Candidatus Nanopelagicales bacterium]